MKVTLVKNGSIKLIVTPQDAIEKVFLEELAKNPVQIKVPDRLEVVDVNLTDSIIISPIEDFIKIPNASGEEPNFTDIR